VAHPGASSQLSSMIANILIKMFFMGLTSWRFPGIKLFFFPLANAWQGVLQGLREIF
jgi:hypothetical protein